MSIKRFTIKFINMVSNYSRKLNRETIDIRDVISCNYSSLSYLSSSSNIIILKENATSYYFKECRKHLSIKKYVENFLKDYFEHISNNSNIYNIILDDLQVKNNFKLFINIPQYVQKHAGITRIYNNWNTEEVGLPTLKRLKNGVICKSYNEFLNSEFAQFIRYVKNELVAYNQNKYVKKNAYQTFTTSLGIATRKLAEVFQIEDMFPDNYYVKLKIDNKDEKFGAIMKSASGKCIVNPTEIQKYNILPEFQRKLCVLNMFDAICFQRDHKKENYFVTFNNMNEINGISVFDNDSPTTFFSVPVINFKTCVQCVSMVKRGLINRPFIDRQFVKVIMNIDINELELATKSYLSPLQIVMVKKRFKMMKRTIKRSVKNNPSMCIDKNQWNKKTIEQEINGQYGKTYLKHFLECDESEFVMQWLGIQNDI